MRRIGAQRNSTFLNGVSHDGSRKGFFTDFYCLEYFDFQFGAHGVRGRRRHANRRAEHARFIGSGYDTGCANRANQPAHGNYTRHANYTAHGNYTGHASYTGHANYTRHTNRANPAAGGCEPCAKHRRYRELSSHRGRPI
jgi:hypothetical protein